MLLMMKEKLTHLSLYWLWMCGFVSKFEWNVKKLMMYFVANAIVICLKCIIGLNCFWHWCYSVDVFFCHCRRKICFLVLWIFVKTVMKFIKITMEACFSVRIMCSHLMWGQVRLSITDCEWRVITLLASGNIILVERLKFTAYVKSMIEVPWPCGQCDHPQDQAAQVWARAGDFVLCSLAQYIVWCSLARHVTLAVSLSTQVYKWVLANSMLGVTLG